MGAAPERLGRLPADAAGRRRHGLGANWITDWYSYDPRAKDILGLADGELVAGFLYLGTSTEAPQERVRPDVAAITTEWSAD